MPEILFYRTALLPLPSQGNKCPKLDTLEEMLVKYKKTKLGICYAYACSDGDTGLGMMLKILKNRFRVYIHFIKLNV